MILQFVLNHAWQFPGISLISASAGLEENQIETRQSVNDLEAPRL
jgi:hypothetical protein